MEVPENHKDDEIENERKYEKDEDDDDDDDDNSNSDGRRRKEDPPTHHYSEPIKYDNQPESSSSTEKITEPLHSASASKHDDDERKIFVGGLHWETTVNDLRDYFSKFGKVVDSTLKTDPATGRSRGFGFVLFENVEAVDKVCDEKSHVLQGKTIDPKRAMSRLNNVTTNNKDPVRKIFVGGVSPDMPEAEIRSYFCKYGKIEEVELPFDRLKNQRRAYVFITFESEKIAEEACALPKQKLGEREVGIDDDLFL
ncbi:hypothetical protein HELRODRAFT_91486 [Helobdella robusta]|uniref:RRM domain-containing protein n=1 Tax=Helobdella robusta TaxID=6412 RepID=T1G842_HELRO|nr:hypothetical protein HELRODRAFT_91486 [Helobdella robusta]ESO11337.1 hypothetical protein HELRODRAFT_91486 [Helobdella robusta]